VTITYLTMFVLSVLSSFALTRIVRNLAIARGWVAPISAHHVHSEPIPRLGGIAIFVSCAIVTGTVIPLARLWRPEIAFPVRTVLYVLGTGALVFLLGLYDDFRPVRPVVKFVVQAAAATILFSGGFGVIHVPLLFGAHTFGWLGLPLTILWVLWITNAFNLIDGVDGLAAGSALFSTLAVFIVSLNSSSNVVTLLSVGLAGAILGFLRFNFNPATIFLGDCGSLFIGFTLSALGAAGAQKAPTVLAVAIPVVSFGLPLLETMISVLRRWLSGQPLFGPDTQHIHHKLLERGLSQRQVVITLYAVSAAFALMSLFLLYPGGTTVGIVFFVLGAIVWVGVQHLGYHEFFELGRVASRTFEQKKIIVNNLAIRRATDALAKVNTIDELTEVLQDAFHASDFDALELVIPDSAIEKIRLEARVATPERRAYDPANPLSQFDDRLRRNRKGRRRSSKEYVGYPGGDWKLELQLVSRDGQRFGSLALFRKYDHHSLPLDVNLLIDQFPTALADAVDRTSVRMVRPVEQFGTPQLDLAHSSFNPSLASSQPSSTP